MLAGTEPDFSAQERAALFADAEANGDSAPAAKAAKASPKAKEAVLGVSLYFELIAPMASKRHDSVQSSSSPPPAKTMSCLPHWICSAPLPMQCAEVEQAEVIE